MIGSSVMRTPTASAIALAIAGGIASRPISPRPFAPNGPLGSYESANATCIFGIIAGAGNRVVLELGSVGVPLYQSKYSTMREADALRDRALHLAFGGGGMNDGAAIDRSGDLQHLHFARVAVDLDFGRLRGEVVGARFVAVAAVVGKLGRVVEVADADDRLATGLVDVARAPPRRPA